MLQDDQIDIEVIFRSQIKSTNRFCQTTVYVAGMMHNISLFMEMEKGINLILL